VEWPQSFMKEWPQSFMKEWLKQVMNDLGREYGRSREKVAPITMAEAKSVHLFVDPESVLGMMQGLAWTMHGLSVGGQAAANVGGRTV
jgi:hypothetical protein